MVLPNGAALCQHGCRRRLLSANSTRCASRPRSRRTGGGTRCGRSAWPSTSAAGERYCTLRARTARGRLITRCCDASAVTHSAATRHCPPPARLGRATAERGWHAACSSRAIATRRRRHMVRPLGAALRQRFWGGLLLSTDGTRRARHARSRRSGGGTLCGRRTWPPASAAGESYC
jgi:hypothetical protein